MRNALSTGSGSASAMKDVKRRAAVAMVLHPAGPDSSILLIRRAEREGDPWSGHMALPGGHTEPEDADTRDTAMRETQEEVGLILSPSEHLGAMPAVQATAGGKPTGTVISPHVFAVTGQSPLTPNDEEVAEAFWTPVAPMARGEWDTRKELVYQGQHLSFPAIDVGGKLVWGLTYRMLTDLFRTLGFSDGKRAAG